MVRPSSSRHWWLIGLLLAWPGLASGQQYDPALHFETIETPHFLIHFHQGGRALAERLAPIAEAIRERMSAGPGRSLPSRTHVILSGLDDVPNGWATPIPFNVLEIRTVWPRASSVLGYTDDWLRMVFSHEYAHIVHLDQSHGVMSAGRRVFGRVPFVMPNLFLPIWQVEGIATWQESALTGGGRVRDGMARRVPLGAARADAFVSIDRASGGLVSWPGGDAPYLYGALFHDYLATRFGVATLDELARRTAARPPFLGAGAFRSTYGVPLGTLWKDFEAAVKLGALPVMPADETASRLTLAGFEPGTPRWDRDEPGSILYTRVTPDDLPALVRVDAETGRETTVVRRFYGEGLGVAPGRLVFDQLDLTRSVALQSDLYLMDRGESGASVRRLTTGARAGEPDLSSDGRHIVAVMTETDRRSLVLLDLGAPMAFGGAPTNVGRGAPSALVPLVSEPGVHFSSPRWSPDRRRVVAERARVGIPAEVVVVDVTTGLVEAIAPGIGERQATPTWTPDGRFVVFAAATRDGPFTLVAVSIDDRRAWAVTSRTDGARAPDISSDGRRIAFLGYTPDGEDVFVAPFDAAGLTAQAALTPRPPAPPPVATAAVAAVAVRAYSPLHGFVPRYWAPIVTRAEGGLNLGGMTSGADALGRHGYVAQLTRRTDTGLADWDVSYGYSRWRPSFFAATSGESRQFDALTETTRSFAAGLQVPFRRVRRSHQVMASVQAEELALRLPTGERETFTRNAVRLGWAFSSAQQFGYSIGAEEGALAAVTSEHVTPGLGADGRADAVAGQARVYQQMGPAHAVLAVRGAGAMSWGDRSVRQRFSIADDGPTGGLFDIGRDAVALFRGAGDEGGTGSRAAVLNVDYRFPLWRVERGLGTYPAFLRWMHAAVFADVGDTWNAGERARRNVSTGIELSADAVVAYSWPVTLTAGVAWVRDATDEVERGPRIFFRVGRSF